MRFYKILITGILVAGISAQAHAINVIDQLQDQIFLPTFTVIEHVNSGAQSFQQASDNVSGAGIFLHPVSITPDDSITIELWDTLPNTGTATSHMLASKTKDLGTTTSGWFDVFWDAPVSVIPNTTLFLAFRSSDTQLGIMGTQSNSYNLGAVYHRNNNGNYQIFPGFDSTFRTYTSVVPVPTAVWLFGTGLIGLFGMRKRNSVVSV